MNIRNVPYWCLIIVLIPLTPITNALIKRQMWPYNKGGPVDRAWNSRE